MLVNDSLPKNFLHEQQFLSLGVTDHCLVIENGEEALALLAKSGETLASALLLLDVHMLAMGGVEFLEAYVQSPTPVIVVLTTSVHPRDQLRMVELPVANYVTKPLTREKVNGLLQQHFQRQLSPQGT